MEKLLKLQKWETRKSQLSKMEIGTQFESIWFSIWIIFWPLFKLLAKIFNNFRNFDILREFLFDFPPNLRFLVKLLSIVRFLTIIPNHHTRRILFFVFVQIIYLLIKPSKVEKVWKKEE